MRLKFTKMHGRGNDFVMLNGIAQTVSLTPAQLRQIADRHFGIGCDHILEPMYAAGASVMGLDWRTRITDARHRLGANTEVQGNLDPALVLAGWDEAKPGCDDVLADNAGHPGHIFNLCHGVQPNTDPGVLEHVVAYIHERTQR